MSKQEDTHRSRRSTINSFASLIVIAALSFLAGLAIGGHVLWALIVLLVAARLCFFWTWSALDRRFPNVDGYTDENVITVFLFTAPAFFLGVSYFALPK